jgi:hypothetical protein
MKTGNTSHNDSVFRNSPTHNALLYTQDLDLKANGLAEYALCDIPTREETYSK